MSMVVKTSTARGSSTSKDSCLQRACTEQRGCVWMEGQLRQTPQPPERPTALLSSVLSMDTISLRSAVISSGRRNWALPLDSVAAAAITAAATAAVAVTAAAAADTAAVGGCWLAGRRCYRPPRLPLMFLPLRLQAIDGAQPTSDGLDLQGQASKCAKEACQLQACRDGGTGAHNAARWGAGAT